MLSSVKRSFQYLFDEQADSSDPVMYSAGYEHIPVDVHAPVLDMRPLPTKAKNRTLSQAAIQGSFSYQRRDYEGFFKDLIASLHGMISPSSSHRILKILIIDFAHP